MSVLRRLGALFGGSRSEDANALRFAVRCSRCGEVIRVRADKRYDLEQEFADEDDRVVGYTLHKEVLGNRCPRLVQVTMRFDRARREVSREIEGGEFV